MKLTPQNCAKIPVTSNPIITKSMQPEIDALVKLVKKTHDQLQDKGVGMDIILDQITKFNQAIRLPSGKLIQSCFTERNTKDRAKKQDLKSKTLALTKNLPIHDTAATNTINYLSKKDKDLSRISL